MNMIKGVLNELIIKLLLEIKQHVLLLITTVFIVSLFMFIFINYFALDFYNSKHILEIVIYSIVMSITWIIGYYIVMFSYYIGDIYTSFLIKEKTNKLDLLKNNIPIVSFISISSLSAILFFSYMNSSDTREILRFATIAYSIAFLMQAIANIIMNLSVFLKKRKLSKNDVAEEINDNN